jgi:hypothetical protein
LKKEVKMPAPLSNDFIGDQHPGWNDLSFADQASLRREWVRAHVNRLGPMDKEQKDQYLKQIEEKAFATAEPWQRPTKPAEMPGIGGTLWEAGTRMIGAPQQLVANILKGAGKGEEKGQEWWYPAVRPLAQTYEYMTNPEAKPTKLPGGEFTSTLTDPLMWTTMGGAGLALALKGKTAAEIAEIALKNPRIMALLKMPGLGSTRKIAEGAVKPATAASLRGVPGALIPKFTEMAPEGQALYTEVTKAPVTRKTVAQSLVPEYGRSFVASTPEQRTALSGLRATPQGEKTLETWLSQPPHLRKSLVKPGIREYSTEFGAGPQPRSMAERVTLGEGLPSPGETASTMEALEAEVSGARMGANRALNLPPVIQKKVKKVPKAPSKKKVISEGEPTETPPNMPVSKFTNTDKLISALESLGPKEVGRYGGAATPPGSPALKVGLNPTMESPFIQSVVRKDKVEQVISKLVELGVDRNSIRISEASWNQGGDKGAMLIRLLKETE